MAKIKVLEPIVVTKYAEEISGAVDFDGEIIRFRYYGDLDVSKKFIYINNNWTSEFDDKYNLLFALCAELIITKSTQRGALFDTDFYL